MGGGDPARSGVTTALLVWGSTWHLQGDVVGKQGQAMGGVHKSLKEVRLAAACARGEDEKQEGPIWGHRLAAAVGSIGMKCHRSSHREWVPHFGDTGHPDANQRRTLRLHMVVCLGCDNEQQ